MMNIEIRSPGPRTRAICLAVALVGCALAASALVPLARRAQNFTSRPTVRTKSRQQTTRNSLATPPLRAPGAITETRRSAPLARSEAATKARLLKTYGKLPLRFEANQGQTDQQVKFLSRGRGYNLFLTGNEAVLELRKPSAVSAASISQDVQLKGLLVSSEGLVGGHESRNLRPQSPPPTTVRMNLVGANPKVSMVGLRELPGKVNYFVGNDPKKWRTNVSTYAKVRYKGVYPGVDLVYHGNQGQLEYDFVVAPGADPRGITLEVNTQHSELEALRDQTETRIRIDAYGNLVLPTEGGEVRFHKPRVYQLISDSGTQTVKSYVDSNYVLKDGHRIGFEVAAYDAGRALIIDPVLSYSSYLGGSMDDFGNAITVDSAGNIYVTGGTTSSDFPTTAGVYQTSYGGADGGYQSVNGDVFVTKLSPSGSTLVYSTYLGGSGDDNAYGIVVDATGNVYLTGGTNSSNFPVTLGAYQPSSGGLTDVFVTKLNSLGSSLLYSTHIGVATEGIRGFGIAVDGAGSAYVTGNAGPGFPTTPGAFQTGSGAFTSAYVMKLNPAGSAADYSTFLSGGTTDYGESIAVDTNGNAFVTGYASSPGFPTTPGGFQTVLGGGVDAFVTVLNPTGSALVYSTFLGGTGNEEGFRIEVDSFGMAYVTGFTASSNFPTTAAAFQVTFGGGNTDAFIAKLDPTKSGAASLIYSTFLGGSGDENSQNFLRDILAVDSAGNAYVTGTTTSTNFPTVNPLQASSGGGFDAYVAKLNPAGSGLIYSTYLGGSGDDFGRGIAVDSSGNVFVTGQTSSANFPVSTNSFQAVFGGSTDAFVAKVIPVASLSQRSLTFASLAVGSTSAAEIATLTNERNAPLNIAGISASGDFAETDTCGTSLAAGLTCAISVTFAPTAPLSRIGSVTITDDASNSPQTLTLSGIGVGPAVTLGGTGGLGNQLVTISSTAQVISVTNSGNAPLTISSIAIGGTNSGDFMQTNTCPGSNATLGANANCTISVTFTPTATGGRTASIIIIDNAPGSPHGVTLTGTGTDFSLAAASGANCPAGGNCSASAAISAGQAATYDLQITPNSGFNGTVALACTGAPTPSACSISPASVSPNGPSSYAFAVTVSNTSNVMVTTPLQMPRTPMLPRAYTALALLSILAAMLVLRGAPSNNHPGRVLAPALAVLVLGLLCSSGCGGGGGPTIKLPTNATLTITAASSGVNRTLSLNLTVNH
jgi:hypothetical protein